MSEANPDAQSVVYVVDDDASVRRALTRLLKTIGHEVRAFASAEEFAKRDPCIGSGCIVLDVRMQGMDGMTLQRQLAAELISTVSSASDLPYLASPNDT